MQQKMANSLEITVDGADLATAQAGSLAVYLQQGLVYLDILDRTGASSATISRVRRSMLDNGAGGVMQEVIRRSGLHERDGEPE